MFVQMFSLKTSSSLAAGQDKSTFCIWKEFKWRGTNHRQLLQSAMNNYVLMGNEGAGWLATQCTVVVQNDTNDLTWPGGCGKTFPLQSAPNRTEMKWTDRGSAVASWGITHVPRSSCPDKRNRNSETDSESGNQYLEFELALVITSCDGVAWRIVDRTNNYISQRPSRIAACITHSEKKIYLFIRKIIHKCTTFLRCCCCCSRYFQMQPKERQKVS